MLGGQLWPVKREIWAIISTSISSPHSRGARPHSQALAGQAQALGEGEAGQGVGVERRRVGHGPAIKGDIPVGLVADKEDVVAVGPALLGQDLRQPGQGVSRVDHTSGVVGGVDEDAGDLLGQHLLKGLQIGLEGRGLGRHHPEMGTGALHIGAVLREVGGKGQYLIPGPGHGAQGVGNGTRRARGGKDILLRIGQAEGPVQVGRHGGAELRGRPGWGSSRAEPPGPPVSAAPAWRR